MYIINHIRDNLHWRRFETQNSRVHQILAFSRNNRNWIENRDLPGETERTRRCLRPRRPGRNRMEDLAFSQTLKKPSLRGAALPPRRRPSRRSSPRRWLLIFELVQNFHNTATAADGGEGIPSTPAGWVGGREGRETSKRERKDVEREREGRGGVP